MANSLVIGASCKSGEGGMNIGSEKGRQNNEALGKACFAPDWATGIILFTYETRTEKGHHPSVMSLL